MQYLAYLTFFTAHAGKPMSTVNRNMMDTMFTSKMLRFTLVNNTAFDIRKFPEKKKEFGEIFRLLNSTQLTRRYTKLFHCQFITACISNKMEHTIGVTSIRKLECMIQ
jgi:hypothetical protein